MNATTSAKRTPSSHVRCGSSFKKKWPPSMARLTGQCGLLERTPQSKATGRATSCAPTSSQSERRASAITGSSPRALSGTRACATSGGSQGPFVSENTAHWASTYPSPPPLPDELTHRDHTSIVLHGVPNLTLSTVMHPRQYTHTPFCKPSSGSGVALSLSTGQRRTHTAAGCFATNHLQGWLTPGSKAHGQTTTTQDEAGEHQGPLVVAPVRTLEKSAAQHVWRFMSKSSLQSAGGCREPACRMRAASSGARADAPNVAPICSEEQKSRSACVSEQCNASSHQADPHHISTSNAGGCSMSPSYHCPTGSGEEQFSHLGESTSPMLPVELPCSVVDAFDWARRTFTSAGKLRHCRSRHQGSSPSIVQGRGLRNERRPADVLTFESASRFSSCSGIQGSRRRQVTHGSKPPPAPREADHAKGIRSSASGVTVGSFAPPPCAISQLSATSENGQASPFGFATSGSNKNCADSRPAVGNGSGSACDTATYPVTLLPQRHSSYCEVERQMLRRALYSRNMEHATTAKRQRDREDCALRLLHDYCPTSDDDDDAAELPSLYRRLLESDQSICTSPRSDISNREGVSESRPHAAIITSRTVLVSPTRISADGANRVKFTYRKRLLDSMHGDGKLGLGLSECRHLQHSKKSPKTFGLHARSGQDSVSISVCSHNNVKCLCAANVPTADADDATKSCTTVKYSSLHPLRDVLVSPYSQFSSVQGSDRGMPSGREHPAPGLSQLKQLSGRYSPSSKSVLWTKEEMGKAWRKAWADEKAVVAVVEHLRSPGLALSELPSRCGCPVEEHFHGHWALPAPSSSGEVLALPSPETSGDTQHNAVLERLCSSPWERPSAQALLATYEDAVAELAALDDAAARSFSKEMVAL